MSVCDKPKNLIGAILTAIIPIFGQIIGRVMSSAKDKFSMWWLFLFFIPPFSFFPAYYVYNNMEDCNKITSKIPFFSKKEEKKNKV